MTNLRHVTKIFVAALFLTFGGCDRASNSSANVATVNDAWNELVSSGPRPARAPGEGELAYFLRDVEATDKRRRDLGLKFWNEFPDDARRYKWLTLTVHMPPHYARDVADWAKREAELSANGAAVDTAAQKSWDEIYPSLRKAFWEAPGVTATERRFLWSGELKQKLRRMIDANARGEAVAAQPLLNEIIKFVATYPKPVDEADAAFWASNVSGPINIAIGMTGSTTDNRSVFGLNDQRALLRFADLLAKTGSGPAKSRASLIRKSIKATGQFDPLATSGLSPAQRAWGSASGTPGDQTSTFESQLIYQHDYFIAARKYRQMGLRMWHKFPERKLQYNWMIQTHWDVPVSIYPARFADAISQRAKNPGAPVQLDQKAQADWERNYAILRADFFADPNITDVQRSTIRSYELFASVIPTQNAWETDRDSARVKALLDGIHQNYFAYGRGEDVVQIGFRILKEYKTLGMTDEDLLGFFRPFRNARHAPLKQQADAAFHTVRLRRTPFEFEAPALKGGSVNVAGLRGKIVLVDHWNTGCAACIQAMPRINKIYKKYRDMGFEVVSICYDGHEKRKILERMEKEMGLSWPTLLANQSLWSSVSKRYGYFGVPQYMLLNRDGTLYAGTGEIDMGRNLEALLQEMLAKEQRGKSQAAIHAS